MNKQLTHGWTFRENSLDFLRLLAAAQVAVLHSFEFTMNEVTSHWFFELLRLFPGVPIFFFISGFLISKSYERAPSLGEYFRNRALRIFPALIVCVFVNLLMVGWTSYFKIVNASLGDITLLFFAKTTILQFYNPEFMRGFGDGVLNGSLWTICVELQFYVLIPVLYRLFELKEKQRLSLLVMLLVVFIVANRFLYLSSEYYSDQVIWKLYRVSFMPWIYMFIFGIIVQRHFDLFAGSLSRVPLFPFFILYTVLSYIFSRHGMEYGNGVPPYVYFPLAILVLRFAYLRPVITHRLLKGNDISYGIYIWHMPLINQLLYLSEEIGIEDVLIVIGSSFAIALCSWFFLEKNMLKLKKFSLKARSRQ